MNEKDPTVKLLIAASLSFIGIIGGLCAIGIALASLSGCGSVMSDDDWDADLDVEIDTESSEGDTGPEAVEDAVEAGEDVVDPPDDVPEGDAVDPDDAPVDALVEDAADPEDAGGPEDTTLDDGDFPHGRNPGCCPGSVEGCLAFCVSLGCEFVHIYYEECDLCTCAGCGSGDAGGYFGVWEDHCENWEAREDCFRPVWACSY